MLPRLQVTDILQEAFPSKQVLGSLEENDEDADPHAGDDAGEEALAELAGLQEVDLDMGKLSMK
jgi:hypothetical protein